MERVADLFRDLGETAADPAAYAVGGLAPVVAIFPPSAGTLAEVMRRAHADGLAVSPRGGGTKMAFGNPPRRVDVVVGTRLLDTVLDCQPANLTVTAQAGVPLDALQSVLKQHGLFLPLDSPFPGRATVGGVLASNVSGPRRLAYGTARDWLIGARVVHADGTVTRTGGKVVKNVTGYDLDKLYVGSLGTLGVIVEASLKVAPLPHVRRTITASFASMEDACQAALTIDRRGLGLLAAVALDSMAIRLMPGNMASLQGGGALLAVELGGRRSAVERREAEVRSVLAEGQALQREALGSEAEAFWQSVVDLGWREEGAPAIAVRCGVSPSEVGRLCVLAGEALRGSGLSVGLAVQPAVGILHAFGWPEGNAQGGLGALAAGVASLRQAVAPLGGYVVVERCAPALKSHLDVWGELPPAVGLMRRVKEQFDPAGTLNPGRFVGGI